MKNPNGSLSVSTVLGPRGAIGTIQNVTATYQLCLPLDYSVGRFKRVPVCIDLHKLGRLARVKMGLSGPTTTGMPSASGVFECKPFFGTTTISTYGSGIVVQIGCTSVEQAFYSAQKHLEALNDVLGTHLQFYGFTASNIVCRVQTGIPCDLLVLKEILGAKCKYEEPSYARKVHNRKEYSGAVVESKQDWPGHKNPPKMTIFAHGCAMFMGCRNRLEILRLMDELYEYIDAVLEHQRHRSLVLYKRARLDDIVDRANKSIKDEVVLHSLLN